MGKQVNFESALMELEAIVQQLDDDGLTLEEAIEAYEQGQKLIQLCQQHLSQAQTRLKTLSPGLQPVETESEIHPN